MLPRHLHSSLLSSICGRSPFFEYSRAVFSMHNTRALTEPQRWLPVALALWPRVSLAAISEEQPYGIWYHTWYRHGNRETASSWSRVPLQTLADLGVAGLTI